MGEPARASARARRDEHIVAAEATRGTETSKYPEEEKSTEIPGVAASETGPSPNPRTRHSAGALLRGACGTATSGGPAPPAQSQRDGVAERHGKAGGTG
jgi:hypothetical protein